MADTITTELKTAEADGITKTAIEAKVGESAMLVEDKPKRIKSCKVKGHAGTIQLQGDPHVRCTWCHAILDE